MALLKKRKTTQTTTQDYGALVELFPSRIIPSDVYYCIFEYLEDDLRLIREGVNYVAVSKQWKEYFMQFIRKANTSDLYSSKTYERLAKTIVSLRVDSAESAELFLKKLSDFRSLKELAVSTYQERSKNFFPEMTRLTGLTSLSTPLIHHEHATDILRVMTGLKRLDMALIDDHDLKYERVYKTSAEFCPCCPIEEEHQVYTLNFFTTLQRLTKLESLNVSFRHLPILYRYMASLTRITNLSFSSAELGLCFASHLSTLTNIERLTLPAWFIPRYTVKQLQKSFTPFTKIKSLTSYLKIKRGQEDILRADLFQRLTKLESLSIADEAQIIDLPEIKCLSIDLHSNHLSSLATMTRLEDLRPTINSLTEDSFLTLTTLTNLHTLGYNERWSESWPMIYEYAKRMTSLCVVHYNHGQGESLPYSWQRVDTERW